MNNLALHLAGLDPEAGAAIRAVGHFDALVESRAGLQSVVRGAAALSGHPARLVDPVRGLVIRVLAGGEVAPPASTVLDPSWPRARVTASGVELVLEMDGPPDRHQAVVLERATAAARAVLQRTRSELPGEDPASEELLLDPGAGTADRLLAAHRLGLGATARAVALPGGRALVTAAGGGPPEGARAGIGPAVEVLELPASAQEARLALRVTAEGTPDDPGPRVVRAEQLGSVALLVRAADGQVVPDVLALEHAAATRAGALLTLDAVATTTSLRDAARVLHVHHSTLQDRLSPMEAALGWDVREPTGRLRLQLALVLRRAARSRP